MGSHGPCHFFRARRIHITYACFPARKVLRSCDIDQVTQLTAAVTRKGQMSTKHLLEFATVALRAKRWIIPEQSLQLVALPVNGSL
jgi:hypothetical protein